MFLQTSLDTITSVSIQSQASLCTQCLCTFINKGPYIDMFVLIYIQTYLINSYMQPIVYVYL